MNIKKRKLNNKIIFLPLCVMMVLIVITALILRSQTRRLLESRLEHELVSLAKICVMAVRFMDTGHGNGRINDIAHEIGTEGGARITIIDQDGNVLGDTMISDKDIAHVENHAMRPEIITAKERGIGISKRYSNTTKEKMIYIALPYRNRHNSGFIRASRALFEIEADLSRQTMTMILLGAIIFPILIGLSIITLIYHSRRIYRIHEQLEDRVRERTSHIFALNQLSSMLTACNTREEAFEVIEKISGRLLPMFFGALSLYRSSRDMLEVSGTWNGEWQGERFFRSQDCWALRTGKNHFFCEGEGIIPCMHAGGKEGQPVMCIPMVAQGETMGVVHIIGNSIDDFTQENKNLATSLVEHAGLALANIQLRETLHQQATRDTLTGLYNRRFLIEYFDSELNRAMRRSQSLSVLMLDLDHFKNLNDSFGHDAGDYVLCEFGKTIRNTLRLEDIACRYGGEEFIVLLPETKLEGAMQVADKLHKAISGLDLKSGTISIGKLTLSIGIAVFPDHGLTQEDLIKAADTGLYRAKKEGRNRTVVSDKEKAGNI